jgi:putative aldouronate transport system permease protein
MRLRQFGRQVARHRVLLLLLLPALIWYGVFCYTPMYGNIIAFKDYSFRRGILGSDWVGLMHFQRLFSDPDFLHVFKNQIVISLMMLLTGFPFSIILALMLHELKGNKLKRFYQTVYTFPHFISWVVVASVLFNFLSSQGVVNQLLQALGLKPQSVFMSRDAFRPFLYTSSIWKEAGWGTIIYLAALTGIDPELYDAASVDGANRWQKMLHITWPGIKPTVAVMLVLSVGGIMSTGFDQIINLDNAAVRAVSDIIDTYVYRVSILKGQNFGYTAAIGLFKSVINLVLLLIANVSVRALGEEGVL